jgi:hypothetical protein
MPFYPGAGVGGNCIPCDPHYLLWQLRAVSGGSNLSREASVRLDLSYIESRPTVGDLVIAARDVGSSVCTATCCGHRWTRRRCATA